MAAIAGPRMQLANPCSSSATVTGSQLGHSAKISALSAIASPAASAASRLLANASTTAPPGTWLTIEAMVPIVRTLPMSRSVQAWAVR